MESGHAESVDLLRISSGPFGTSPDVVYSKIDETGADRTKQNNPVSDLTGEFEALWPTGSDVDRDLFLDINRTALGIEKSDHAAALAFLIFDSFAS